MASMTSIAWSLLVFSFLSGLIQFVEAYTDINDQKKYFGKRRNLDVMPDIRWAHQCMMEDERFQGFRLNDIDISHAQNEEFQFPPVPDASDRLSIIMSYERRRAQDRSTRMTDNAELEFTWPGLFRPRVDTYSGHSYVAEAVPIDIDRDLGLGVPLAAEIVHQNFGRRLPMPAAKSPLWHGVVIKHQSLGKNLPFIYQPTICAYDFYHRGSRRPREQSELITLPVEDGKARADLIHTGDYPDYPILWQPTWLGRKRPATGLLRS